jgi:CHAD domain-containing protein
MEFKDTEPLKKDPWLAEIEAMQLQLLEMHDEQLTLAKLRKAFSVTHKPRR